MTDLHFQEQGSVWLVQPITPKGEAWMTDHTSVRALRWFGAIEIDRCFAQVRTLNADTMGFRSENGAVSTDRRP